MESSTLRQSVAIPGDLEITLADDEMGRFLDGDPDLVHARRAYISSELVEIGSVKIDYDPNKGHKAPVDVYMQKAGNGLHPLIMVRLTPVSDPSVHQASVDKIAHTARRFLEHAKGAQPKQNSGRTNESAVYPA